MTKQNKDRNLALTFIIVVVLIVFLGALFWLRRNQKVYQKLSRENVGKVESAETVEKLNTAAYDAKILQLANNPVPTVTASPTPTPTPLWPVKTVYPNTGAVLPFSRIVAYYGNFYSKNMGVLGEYPEDEMLNRLNAEVQKWQQADPSTPVIPAIHYIAVVAQGGAGKDGNYRLRMPDSQIQKAIDLADKINGLVFLDVQVGRSNVQAEIPLLEKYLKNPKVHLGIDPEFAVNSDQKPGQIIGTLDATDINFTAQYLAKLVRENNLPPKILIVHRFTQHMVTNYKQIEPLPEVQIVMCMDGFGAPANKLNTYKQYIYKEPVQFTGFKLFYKNDIKATGKMLRPEDLLKLTPIPIYIQYQ